MKLLSLGTFGDADIAHDDFFLDSAFRIDEQLDGVKGLLSAAAVHGVNKGRIPFDKIYAPLGRRVEFVKGWETRGAPVMNPVAAMSHWTAVAPSVLRPEPCLNVCINGRGGPSPVPGPMCHEYIGGRPVMKVICSGRANHAGVGHQALLAEMRSGTLPAKSAAQRGLKDTGGSGGALIGREVEAAGNGKQPLAPGVLELMVDADALKAAWFGWVANRVAWHHALWTRRKIDYTLGKMAPWPGQAKYAEMVAARLPWAANALVNTPR
jgi:hypothetical protein